MGRGPPASQDEYIGDHDEDYRELPPIDDGIDKNEHQDDNELSVDEDIEAEEVAELLDDARDVVNNPVQEPDEPMNANVDDENQPADENIDENIQCDPEEPDEASLGVPPSLISEPEGRPTRERAAPERYNPETGTSYYQKVACHNIICQEEPEERTLEYTEDESKVVANIIVGLMRKCHMQQMIMQKGIKAFAPDGEPAAKEELRQMHSRTCFQAIAVAELARREKLRAQEGLMFLSRLQPK